MAEILLSYEQARREEFAYTAGTAVELFSDQAKLYKGSPPGEARQASTDTEWDHVRKHLELVGLDLVRANDPIINKFERDIESPDEFRKNVAGVALRALAEARIEHEKIKNTAPGANGKIIIPSRPQ